MSQQAVPKAEFARHLRSVADAAGNGAFIVLTAANTPVMIRLSGGEITTLHCRGYDVQKAIDTLAPSEQVRYSFSAVSAENKPSLIEVSDFLEAIDAMVLPGDGGAPTPAGDSEDRWLDEPVSEEAKEQLMALATEVIGPVAALIVEDALAQNTNLRATIDEIRAAIPETDAAERFVAIARERLSGRSAS